MSSSNLSARHIPALIRVLLLLIPPAGPLSATPADQPDRKWAGSEISPQAAVKGLASGSRHTIGSASMASKTAAQALEKLVQFEARLRELDQEAQELEGHIQKQTELIRVHSNGAGRVELEALFFHSPSVKIEYVRIDLDGSTIFKDEIKQQYEAEKDAVHFFSGYLRPGKHQLELNMRFFATDITKVPDKQSFIRLINKSFSIEVPSGTFHKLWQLAIYAPATFNEPIKTELIESGLKRPEVRSQE